MKASFKELLLIYSYAVATDGHFFFIPAIVVKSNTRQWLNFEQKLN